MRDLAIVEAPKWREGRLESTEAVRKALRCAASPEEALGALRRLVELESHAAANTPGEPPLNRELFRSLCFLKMRLARAEPSVERQVNLCFEAAQLAEDHAGDTALTLECYQMLLERAPADTTALACVERFLNRSGDFARLGDFYSQQSRRLANRGMNVEQATFLLKLAELKFTRLGDTQGALALYRRVLREQPGHSEAIAALEQWASSPHAGKELAGALLESALEGPGFAIKRKERLSNQLDAAVLPTERVALLRKLARLWAEELLDPEQAFLSIGRAFRELPAEPALLRDCVAFAKLASADEELEMLLTDVADSPGDPLVRARIYRTLATLQREQGRDQEAAESWNAVAELLPDDAEARQHLQDLMAGPPREPEAAEACLVRKLNHAAHPEEQLQLLLELGDLQERKGDLQSAADSFDEAVRIRSTPEALRLLERVLSRLGRCAEQAEVISKLAGHVDPDARAGLLLQRAEVLERGGELESAAKAFESLLSFPGEAKGALAGLERLSTQPSVQRRIADVLEPLYVRQNAPAKRVWLRELELGAASLERQVQLLQEIAQLKERLDEHRAAFDLYVRAFKLAPELPPLRVALIRVAPRAGGREQLIPLFQKALAHPLPPAAALELWSELAILLSAQPGRVAEAVHAWEEAFRLSPKRREPLQELARLHRAAQNHRELARALIRTLELTSAAEERVGMLSELGGLAAGALGNLELAMLAYQEILETQPHDLVSLSALDGIYTRTHRWFELTSVLERQMRLALQRDAISELTELELRLARLRANHVEDPEGALELLQSILARERTHAGGIRTLEELILAEADGSPVKIEAAALLEVSFCALLRDPKTLVSMVQLHLSLTGEKKPESARPAGKRPPPLRLARA